MDMILFAVFVLRAVVALPLRFFSAMKKGIHFWIPFFRVEIEVVD